MMYSRWPRWALTGVLFAFLMSACATRQPAESRLGSVIEPVLAGEHRSPAHRARDVYRHPRETLEFFGLRPEMTVVEVWPGSGWYTEILAPLLRERGKLFVAQLDATSGDYAKTTVEAFRAKLQARPDLYDKVEVTMLGPAAAHDIAPAGSADLVVTFRNLHNWMMFGRERDALSAMHRALKDGGVLGIVEHRGDPGVPQDPKAASGYVNEQYAIDLIESAGFKLAARSDINGNPRDTKNYEKGVWSLPPTFAAGEEDRARYAQIGESDRFTLKFVKVAQ